MAGHIILFYFILHHVVRCQKLNTLADFDCAQSWDVPVISYIPILYIIFNNIINYYVFI